MDSLVSADTKAHSSVDADTKAHSSADANYMPAKDFTPTLAFDDLHILVPLRNYFIENWYPSVINLKFLSKNCYNLLKFSPKTLYDCIFKCDYQCKYIHDCVYSEKLIKRFLDENLINANTPSTGREFSLMFTKLAFGDTAKRLLKVANVIFPHTEFSFFSNEHLMRFSFCKQLKNTDLNDLRLKFIVSAFLTFDHNIFNKVYDEFAQNEHFQKVNFKNMGASIVIDFISCSFFEQNREKINSILKLADKRFISWLVYLILYCAKNESDTIDEIVKISYLHEFYIEDIIKYYCDWNLNCIAQLIAKLPNKLKYLDSRHIDLYQKDKKCWPFLCLLSKEEYDKFNLPDKLLLSYEEFHEEYKKIESQHQPMDATCCQ